MNISYNISPRLIDILHNIQESRKSLLILSLSPRHETRLRWEALVSRIYFSMNLEDIDISRSQVTKIISHQAKSRASGRENQILNLRRAFDYIYFDWTANVKPVNLKAYQQLSELIKASGNIISDSEAKRILDYIQVRPENPVVQAAIAMIKLAPPSAFSKNAGFLARLISYLFLYKGGMDFKGLLVIEEFWQRDKKRFIAEIEKANSETNLTGWLEFFAESVMVSLEKATNIANTGRSQTDLGLKYWDLSERQKGILASLAEPGSTINNRQVQKAFKISQITASRDLAKLVSFSLVVARGKGRSVQYSKF